MLKENWKVSVKQFSKFAEESAADPVWGKDFVNSPKDMAVGHLQVIEKFGRFPKVKQKIQNTYELYVSYTSKECKY
jgi:uncharacterized protein (DUF924 family)